MGESVVGWFLPWDEWHIFLQRTEVMLIPARTSRRVARKESKQLQGTWQRAASTKRVSQMRDALVRCCCDSSLPKVFSKSLTSNSCSTFRFLPFFLESLNGIPNPSAAQLGPGGTIPSEQHPMSVGCYFWIPLIFLQLAAFFHQASSKVSITLHKVMPAVNYRRRCWAGGIPLSYISHGSQHPMSVVPSITTWTTLPACNKPFRESCRC